MQKNLITIFTLISLLPVWLRGIDSLLYINQDLVLQFQQQVQKGGTHHQVAFQNLKQRVDQGDLSVYGEAINRYNRSYLAQEAAFASLLSADESARKVYAQQAFSLILDIYELPEQERKPDTDYGLSRAMMQLALALPYNWCRQYWNAEQVQFVEQKITQALDAWLTYDHANFWHSRGSNWVAVCRGGELILLLAANLQDQRKERYDFLIGQLQLHMQNGYGSLGASQEGMGYTEYGGQFLLKAVFAAAGRGDSTLYQEARKHAWWRMAMYAESFQGHQRKTLMTGVTGGSGFNEGWASLLLNLVPSQDRPYFLWWYDRHMGLLSVDPRMERFDGQRAGTIWSILYYPLQAERKDPTGVFPAMVVDDHGYYFFRNRWQDEHDIQFSVMADAYHHSHAWDQPEVFALNLMAYNTRFIGGPEKKREQQQYSSLLVDGLYNRKGASRLVGKKMEAEVRPQGGFVAIDGGQLYDSLGLSFAQRRVAVHFLEGNRAIIGIWDTIRDETLHDLTWQLNLGNMNVSEDLTVSKQGTSFQIKGAEGQIHGWVISPEPIRFGADKDPFQVHYRAKASNMLVVLYLSPDEKEIPSLKQTGPYRYFLEGLQISLDVEEGR